MLIASANLFGDKVLAQTINTDSVKVISSNQSVVYRTVTGPALNWITLGYPVGMTMDFPTVNSAAGVHHLTDTINGFSGQNCWVVAKVDSIGTTILGDTIFFTVTTSTSWYPGGSGGGSLPGANPSVENATFFALDTTSVKIKWQAQTNGDTTWSWVDVIGVGSFGNQTYYSGSPWDTGVITGLNPSTFYTAYIYAWGMSGGDVDTLTFTTLTPPPPPTPPTITMLTGVGAILSANVTDTISLQTGHTGKILKYFRLTPAGPMFPIGSITIPSTGIYSVSHTGLPAGTIYLRDFIIDLVSNDTVTNNQLAVTVLPQPIACSLTHVSTVPTMDGAVETMNLNSGMTTMTVIPVVYLPFNGYSVGYSQTPFTYNTVGSYVYTFTGYPSGYTFKYKFRYSNGVNSDSTSLITVTTLDTMHYGAWNSGVDSFATPASANSITIYFRTNVYGLSGTVTAKYGTSATALSNSMTIALPALYGEQPHSFTFVSNVLPGTTYYVQICDSNALNTVPYCSVISQTATASVPIVFGITTDSAVYSAGSETIFGTVYLPVGTIGYPNVILATDANFSNTVTGSAQALPSVSVSGTVVSISFAGTTYGLIANATYYVKFYGPCSNGDSENGTALSFVYNPTQTTGIGELSLSEESSFQVFDLMGRKVLEGENLNKGAIPNLNDLPAGTYIVRSKFETRKVQVFH